MTDLLFDLPPGGTDLLFGESGGAVETVNATITGNFAPLTVSVFIADVQTATITGSFAPLTVAIEAQYASNTARPTVGQTSHQWQVATPASDGCTTTHQEAPAQPVGWATFWQRAIGAPVNVEHVLPDNLVKSRSAIQGVFEAGVRAHNETGFRHQDGDASVRKSIHDAFEGGVRAHNETGFRHQDGIRIKRSVQSLFENAARLEATRYSEQALSARRYQFCRTTLWQEGVPPPPGITIYVPPPDPGQEPCYTPNTALLFSFPFTTSPHLLFQCGNFSDEPPPPVGEVVVPVRKVYIVANNVFLKRVSDNAPVLALSMSLSLDVDSWTWGFSATLPAVSQSLVEPTTGPVELEASVNGTAFRVLAESMSRERSFGQSTIRVAGRGRNAMLDAPYSPIQTFGNDDPRTAQQLMDDVLTFNGVPMGWTINWELEDWAVPATVFNHQGSYITALVAIAKAAGGYLLPHPSTNSFKVKHLYPTVPWAWNTVTPDFTLPADVAVRESLQWQEKAAYNRVFVSGQQQGILGQVTRAGTAGEVLAPMVVDQLITDTIAARQRGRAILSDTGRQITTGLRLPVLAETGIIQPGSFIRYEDGGITRLGLVRSTNVEVAMPEVWQSLEVETHA